MGCVTTNTKPPVSKTPTGPLLPPNSSHLKRTISEILQPTPLYIKQQNPILNSSGGQIHNSAAPALQTSINRANLESSNLSGIFNSGHNQSGAHNIGISGDKQPNHQWNDEKNKESDIVVSRFEDLKRSDNRNSQFFNNPEVIEKSNDKVSTIVQNINNSANNDSGNSTAYFPSPPVPYPQKPNFDWAKDIDEQNFDTNIEVALVPNVDIKIS